jgi:hypothetical protein
MPQSHLHDSCTHESSRLTSIIPVDHNLLTCGVGNYSQGSTGGQTCNTSNSPRLMGDVVSMRLQQREMSNILHGNKLRLCSQGEN